MLFLSLFVLVFFSILTLHLPQMLGFFFFFRVNNFISHQLILFLFFWVLQKVPLICHNHKLISNLISKTTQKPRFHVPTQWSWNISSKKKKNGVSPALCFHFSFSVLLGLQVILADNNNSYQFLPFFFQQRKMFFYHQYIVVEKL